MSPENVKFAATFGWLCVETNLILLRLSKYLSQPPSCGCVLKLICLHQVIHLPDAATFGWLCVETARISWQRFLKKAAASAQPCVETININPFCSITWAAIFGWLCVETVITIKLPLLIRAAAYLSRMKEDK